MAHDPAETSRRLPWRALLASPLALATCLALSGCFVPWPHHAPRVSGTSGLVVSGGTPVPGAEVWWAEADAQPPCTPAVGAVRSDATGRYRLPGEAARRWGYPILPPGSVAWDVCARPPGGGKVRGYRVRFLGPRGAPETATVHLELRWPDFLVEPSR